MRTRRCYNVLCSIGLTVIGACASEVADVEDDVVTVQAEPLKVTQTCNDKLADVYTQPKSNSSGKHGDLVRCAKGRKIAMDEITTALANQGFVGADVQNSVRLYRISYRTQRLGQTQDVATALVALPAGRGGANVESDDDDVDTQNTVQSQNKNKNKKTLVVYTHGTIPYGTSCADSRHDPLQQSDLPFVDLELYTVIAFAAHGFPVMMPDYAGFVTGSRASGYLTSEDEAHAALDLTRVHSKLAAVAQDNVVVVGHSQGGHAALSVQSIAKAYGVTGKLAGVVAFAPFWAAARTFGAIVAPEAGFDTQTPLGAANLGFAIEYFYTHAELYDGPGAGTALFTASAQAALPGFVSTCDFAVAANPSVLGRFSTDIFQTDFLNAVGPCGLGVPGGCSANTLATNWEKRFVADRPKLDSSGAPVVLWQGKNDVVVPTDVAACGIETIAGQLSGNKFKVCGDPNGDHESIEPAHAAWVTQWIEARTLGTADPTADCQDKSVLQLPACSTPGGNVD